MRVFPFVVLILAGVTSYLYFTRREQVASIKEMEHKLNKEFENQIFVLTDMDQDANECRHTESDVVELQLKVASTQEKLTSVLEKVEECEGFKSGAEKLRKPLSFEMDGLRQLLEEIELPNNGEGIIKNPTFSGRSETIPIELYKATKFAYQWMLSFWDEGKDGSLREMIWKIAHSPIEFPSKEGTSWKCYELFQGVKINIFDGKPKMSTGSVCIFENLCVFDRRYNIIYDPTSDVNSLRNGKVYDWPQTVNAVGPKVVAHSVTNLHEFFNNTNIKWKKGFSWIINSSYERHTAHFFENVSQMWITKYALKNLIPDTHDVYFGSHSSNLFDWQDGYNFFLFFIIFILFFLIFNFDFNFFFYFKKIRNSSCCIGSKRKTKLSFYGFFIKFQIITIMF